MKILTLLERAVEGGETELLGKIRTKAYDPVINGVEMASGSIRIHRRDVQRLVFKALGMTHGRSALAIWFLPRRARVRHAAARRHRSRNRSLDDGAGRH